MHFHHLQSFIDFFRILLFFSKTVTTIKKNQKTQGNPATFLDLPS